MVVVVPYMLLPCLIQQVELVVNCMAATNRVVSEPSPTIMVRLSVSVPEENVNSFFSTAATQRTLVFAGTVNMFVSDSAVLAFVLDKSEYWIIATCVAPRFACSSIVAGRQFLAVTGRTPASSSTTMLAIIDLLMFLLPPLIFVPVFDPIRCPPPALSRRGGGSLF